MSFYLGRTCSCPGTGRCGTFGGGASSGASRLVNVVPGAFKRNAQRSQQQQQQQQGGAQTSRRPPSQQPQQQQQRDYSSNKQGGGAAPQQQQPAAVKAAPQQQQQQQQPPAGGYGASGGAYDPLTPDAAATGAFDPYAPLAPLPGGYDAGYDTTTTFTDPYYTGGVGGGYVDDGFSGGYVDAGWGAPPSQGGAWSGGAGGGGGGGGGGGYGYRNGGGGGGRGGRSSGGYSTGYSSGYNTGYATQPAFQGFQDGNDAMLLEGLDGGYSGYGSGWGSGDYGWGEEEEVEVVEDRTPKYVNGKRVLVNSDITARRVRVQDAAKAEMGVMEYEEARQLAIASDADVILINDSGDPPVVRLIAFGKYKFEIERATKQKQKSSKGTETKEVRLRPVTEPHDFEVKVKAARGFLAKGNKVKLTMTFSGREMRFKDQGKELMLQLIEALSPVSKADAPLSLRPANFSITLSPLK